MREELMVKVKQQPFGPRFVLQVGDEQISGHVGDLDDKHVVARINNKGAYKIDVSDVGFFFVEKPAKPYESSQVPARLNGGILARTLRAGAESLGEHCGSVITELQYVCGVLLPGIRTTNGRGRRL